jgi:hypothetical protein
MIYNKIFLTEKQIDTLISNGSKDFYSLGLRFVGWKDPYEVEVIDKKKWMLAKIKYGV